MSWFKRSCDDYFDEEGVKSGKNNDRDLYDEEESISDPSNPVWDGSEVHINPYGTDHTIPDPNEVNQD